MKQKVDDRSDRAMANETTDSISARIAVLIPCYNEELTVAKVIDDFRRALPAAEIYVYDNNSADRTAEVARAAGAIVRHETLQGKGNVVRRMFADIDADVYILVDGDATYDAQDAPLFVRELLNGTLDMVNGQRIARAAAAYRPGHRFGNVLLSGLVRTIFGNRIKDMLSGYKVVSRRYAKSFPGLSRGFEIETERSEDSPSKLRTVRDGFRIIWTIIRLVRAERPLEFFCLMGALLAAIATGLAIPLFITYWETGLVPRFPTAILSASIMLLAFNSVFAGLILDTVTRGRQEMKRMQYLAVSAARAQREN
jgi:glycosyltransferase involved in cell wall biosynthesis